MQVEPDPKHVAEQEPEPVAETEPVLEISHPDLPAGQAPPGLSLDAFKDMKPVAFGGVSADEDEEKPVVEDPAVETAPEPAPPVEPETVVEPEPVLEIQAEPTFEHEPVMAPEPMEPEPILEIPVEPTFEPEPLVEPEPEPEPAVAAAVAVPVADEPKPKKRGLRIPNPELKLPSFGKKKTTAATVDAPKETKPKGGLKLPQITLPPNLQGPLNEVERKIALGSVIAIVAAAAFGYLTAPAEDAAAPSPAPAPAATSR